MSPSHLLLVGGLTFSSPSYRLLQVAHHEFGSTPPCLHSCRLIAVVIFADAHLVFFFKILPTCSRAEGWSIGRPYSCSSRKKIIWLLLKDKISQSSNNPGYVIKIPSFVYYLCSSDGPDQAHISLVHQISSGSWPGSAQDSGNLETNVIIGEWNKRTTTWSAVRKNCFFRFWRRKSALSFRTKLFFRVNVGGKALTAVWSTVALLDKVHITRHMKIRLLSAVSLVLPTFTFLKRKPAFCKLKSDSWVLKDAKKFQRPQQLDAEVVRDDS